MPDSRYRSFVRARFVRSWGMYDAGLVKTIPTSFDAALALIPAALFQEIDWFVFVGDTHVTMLEGADV